MDANKFGAFLAQLRKEQNMTQSELASKLQVTDKAVSRWERGVGLPDISTLEPLSEALQVSVLELLKSERLDHCEVACPDVSEPDIDAVKQAPNEQKRFKKRMLAVCAGMMCVALIPLAAFLIGAERFPYRAFFCFLIPLYILCTIEYLLCKRNKVLAILMPAAAAFSAVAFGRYAFITAVALLIELVVMRYMNRTTETKKKE